MLLKLSAEGFLRIAEGSRKEPRKDWCKPSSAEGFHVVVAATAGVDVAAAVALVSLQRK